jgi:hypothetical protein
MPLNNLSGLVREVLSNDEPIGFLVECEDPKKNVQGTIFPPSKTGWCEVTLVGKNKHWELKNHRDELFIEAENLLVEMNFKKNNNKRPFNWKLISTSLDPKFTYSTYLRHGGV